MVLCEITALGLFLWYTGTGYGYSRHHLSDRLLRQFCVFNIATPTDATLHSIYSRSVYSVIDSFVSSEFHRRTEFVEVVFHSDVDIRIYLPLVYFCYFHCIICTVSTTSGNSGNIGNLLEFS